MEFRVLWKLKLKEIKIIIFSYHSLYDFFSQFSTVNCEELSCNAYHICQITVSFICL